LLKERPDIGAAVPTSLTGEPRLQVGQADFIEPAAAITSPMFRLGFDIRGVTPSEIGVLAAAMGKQFSK
jgi:hypothetical protein